MALGGGTFTVQDKILPGAYINFVSAARAASILSDRGIATMALSLHWGPDNEMFTVTSDQFQRDCLKIFGYENTHEEMKGLRDLFQNIKTAHLFKLNSGGIKASNEFATANYGGIRGNTLQIVIEAAESSTEAAPKYDVSTVLENAVVATQKGVTSVAELTKNDFVTFKSTATIALTAGTPLTGGTNGTAADAAHQTYLDKAESYSFNTMGCLSDSSTVKALYASFTKRMRDENGVKFQTVLHRYTGADYEGVISVENGLADDEDKTDLVYWVTGAQAGCPVNKSLVNATYTGEYDVYTDYTQAELAAGIQSGKLMLHKVGDEVRVLEDINTFVNATEGKSADFSNNQVIRVLDQIGNDIAALFNDKYLGKIPNDNAGRISLWNDIVKHHKELSNIQAIEGFEADNVTVEQGDNKKSVVVTDYITPIYAMAQLYMTVIVQ